MHMMFWAEQLQSFDCKVLAHFELLAAFNVVVGAVFGNLQAPQRHSSQAHSRRSCVNLEIALYSSWMQFPYKAQRS
jgi:hypothetical protein